MSIKKDQLISALKQVTDNEFDVIPMNEENINFSFSKKFETKTKKLLRSQKKPYYNLINTSSKKVAVVCLAIITLFSVSLSIKPVRISAIEFFESIISKRKNIYQVAYEKGIPLSQVDTEGNFKHTDFTNEENEITTDETTSAITGENFDNPKTQIYNKMLNSIDFFSTVELSAMVHMGAAENLKIDYYSNLDNSTAYEAVYDSGKLIRETFANPGYYFLNSVNHIEKTYDNNYLSIYKRSDTPYIPLNERIVYFEETKDGLPGYTYRRNITNCPLASYSIVPQEIAFSYLADFDRWEIVNENTEFLGRKCIEIEGTPTPYTGEKHNCQNFKMLVDESTGILLKFEGYQNGNISSYITATKCIIDEDITIKEFDIANYESYNESSRYYIERHN